MSFKSALQSVADGIKDLSQLNVRTYTGTVSAQIDGEKAEDMIRAARNSGDLKVVGITTMKLDGDVDQFFSNDEGIQQKVHDAHYNAVQAAQKSRDATLAMFANAVRKVVDKIELSPDA